MKQLMVHVERIVRPIRAMECRKLHMRRELLAHLQSAVAEELSFGQSEAAAAESAASRLGDPRELTHQLQRTVPWVQRILLARFSVSPGIERWSTKATRRIYGVGPTTPMHISILSALAALLSALPCYFDPAIRYSINHAGISPVHPACFFLALLAIWQAIYVFSCRLIVGSSDPLARFSTPGVLKRSAIVVASQNAMTVATTASAFDRWPTLAEEINTAGATLVVIVVSIFVARRVALLRDRYTEWLTLNLA